MCHHGLRGVHQGRDRGVHRDGVRRGKVRRDRQEKRDLDGERRIHPKVGDACVYDWQDGANYATTDNTGAPDHIGIVTKVGGGTFVVTEGNMNGGKVGKRTMKVNGRYIRGFITPDFDMIARKLGGTSGGTADKPTKPTTQAAVHTP